jgi:uncharacterized membrane protein YraQ (UPF0718 family)/regulator of protease activity HflC (stomatin/prohibitin superfamily)
MSIFWRQFVGILNDSAIYLLVGFALAGFLHVLFEKRRGLLDPLSGTGRRPIVLATLWGLPLPLCSCSVLPTGLTLLRKGIGKGAASAFLITVPETDAVSILLTYGLIGPIIAVFRPLAALVTGITTGMAIDVVESHRSRGQTGRSPLAAPDPDTSPLADLAAAGRPVTSRAARYGFGEFFDDVIARLLVGIAIGAAIAALLPALPAAIVQAHPALTYLAMLVIGVPMYVCATSSTPIAAGLIAGGVSPGAALVFLLVGPATNMASMLVLSRQFGRLVFGVYLGTIAVCSLAMGLLLDLIVAGRSVARAVDAAAASGAASPWLLIGTIAFLLLALRSLRRTRVHARLNGWLVRRTGINLARRSFGAGIAVLALILYLASGLFTIAPGERGATRLFGKVTALHLGPGLHVRWPSPFGAADILAVSQIRRVETGLALTNASAASGDRAVARSDNRPFEQARDRRAETTAASWMLTGDENFLDLQAVIQYRIEDTPEAFAHFLYGLVSGDDLVRAATAWSLHKAVAQRGIDSLLTVDRQEVEQVVRNDYLQPLLDACESGISVIGVSLRSVHAPPPVHPAFREVASAAEDAARSLSEGREYRERAVREARGAAILSVSLARGHATEAIATARGESTAFVLQADVERREPYLLRSRLYWEQLEAVLPELDKYVDLTNGRGPGPQVWLRQGDSLETLPFLKPPSSPSEEKP